MLFIADKYIIIENGSRVCCYHVPPRKIKTILVFAMFLLYKQMFFLVFAMIPCRPQEVGLGCIPPWKIKTIFLPLQHTSS